MTRRRRENVGEPLFGEDWWVADQKLFEDSLIRQQARPAAPRRRPRRAGTMRKRNRPAPSGLVQDMLPGFGEQQGAADGEPVRGDGPQALGAVAAGPVRGDRATRRASSRTWGSEAEQRIDALAWELAGDDPPGEGYLAKAGRLGEARHRAEQIVLDEMILLPPEPGAGQTSPQLASFRPARPGRPGPVGRGQPGPRQPRGAVGAAHRPAASAVPRRRPSRTCWPAGQGGARCPRCSTTARAEFAWAREQLAGLLSPAELAAARRNTLNAHYTDAALVQAIWEAVRALGFERGRVLEPGCGSGNFIAFAPDGAQVTGVELDPVTAGIAALLLPAAPRSAPSRSPTARDADGSL